MDFRLTTQLALFPAGSEELLRAGRLHSLRCSPLFSGFDRTLCAFLRNDHHRTVLRPVDESFAYLDLGFGGSRGGLPGAVAVLGRRVHTLVDIARAFGVDAVIAYDPHLLGFAGFMTSRWLHIPLAIRLVSNYGLTYEHTGNQALPALRSRRVELALERWMYREADLVAVACPDHERYVRRIGGADVRTSHYVTAQADIFYEDFAVDQGLRRKLAPGAERLVVAVSRLSPEKFPHDLVECAARLGADPGVQMLLVGDGILRAELEHQARLLRAPILFAGVRSQEEVRSLLSTADAVVVLQGGGAITEASLCGAPVVAYDYEMNPFVVRPEEREGWLVPFRGVEALATAVRSCLYQSQEAAARGNALRQGARTRFSRERATAAERQLAERLLRPQ